MADGGDTNSPDRFFQLLLLIERLPLGALFLVLLFFPFAICAWKDPKAFVDLMKFCLTDAFIQAVVLMTLGVLVASLFWLQDTSKRRIKELAAEKRKAESQLLGGNRPSLDEPSDDEA